MIITRQKYLDMLVAGQGNGLVKIVTVVKDDIKRKIDDDGVVTIGLFDYLLDEQSIERY